MRCLFFFFFFPWAILNRILQALVWCGGLAVTARLSISLTASFWYLLCATHLPFACSVPKWALAFPRSDMNSIWWHCLSSHEKTEHNKTNAWVGNFFLKEWSFGLMLPRDYSKWLWENDEKMRVESFHNTCTGKYNKRKRIPLMSLFSCIILGAKAVIVSTNPFLDSCWLQCASHICTDNNLRPGHAEVYTCVWTTSSLEELLPVQSLCLRSYGGTGGRDLLRGLIQLSPTSVQKPPRCLTFVEIYPHKNKWHNFGLKSVII